MSDALTLSEALAELDKLGTFGRAIAKAREVGEALRSADQLIRERTDAAARLLEQVTAAQADVDAAKAAAATIREATKRECLAAVAKAKDTADETVAAANKARQVADAEVALAKAQAADVRGQASAAQAALDAARAELTQVQKQIAEAKADALRRFGT